MNAVLPFEERAVPKLPPVERGYQVIAHPDGAFPVYDVEDIRPAGAFPHLYIVGARAGDHVRQTAGAAPQALRPGTKPFIPSHWRMIRRIRRSVKGISKRTLDL